jgi:hypothetical protein
MHIKHQQAVIPQPGEAMSLSRRDFIKVCGASLSLATLGFSDPNRTHGADCLLLEARAFAEHGGWVLDPQFEDIMGSPYLLAHGMGKPVANARTTAAFPGRSCRPMKPGEHSTPV